jgi:membrane protease YdiL (CAAX protease family)
LSEIAISVAAAAAGVMTLVAWAALRAAGRDPLGPRPGGKLPETGWALLAGAVLWYLVTQPVLLLLAGTEVSRLGGQTLTTFAAQVVHGLVAVALLPLVVRKGLEPRASAGRIVTAGLVAGTVAVALQVVLWIAIQQAIAALGRPMPGQQIVAAAARAEGFDVLAYAAGAIVLAPFAEEVFFRGALLPVLVGALGPRAGNLAQAAVFGAIHFVPQPAAWPLAIPLAGVGWIAGWLYLRTGSLAAPMAMHAAFNAVNFAALRAMPPA